MITVKGLTYRYAGSQHPAVKDVTFNIEQGEIFGFLGPSGAGKSTTQKILIGLLKDYSGEVSIMGRSLQAWGKDYYERVGVSFELPNHFLKLTARENLTYFGSLYQHHALDPQTVLEWVGLADATDQRVAGFSKGMKNRLNVARALLHQPDLLFLDEPTSGLDPVNARLIRDLIRRVRDGGTTVFLTTHNMSVADDLCDRVAFLVDGEIKLIDAPRDLKLRYGQRMVRVEFGAADCVEFALDGLGQNPDFLQIIQRADVETIHTQETTLERVFINLTGKELA